MISYLKVPKTDLTDFYEKARFALTWRIAILFSAVIGFLGFISWTGSDRFFWYYFSVLLIVLVGIAYMYKTRQYKFVCKLIVTGSTLIIAFSVLFIDNAIHAIEPLWMIILILLSFFTLGKAWGVSLLFANATLFFIYYNFLFTETIDLRIKVTEVQILIMSIEFVFSMFLIGYIMFQFSLVNSYAERHKKAAFEALKAEKSIVEEQNKEKTVLLQEIHHRVKNNLQVIISLLRIQSGELKSKEAQESFNDAISRIMTMSLIHKKMYEKESLVNIDIQDYLHTLIADLVNTNVTKGKISFKVDANIENIGSKSIVPLALIINELVSNSLKHAFEENGNIELSIKNTGSDYFEMKYSDNGEWKNISDKSTFGMQLLEVFSDQLEGDYKRTTDEKGTHYTFHLKTIEQ